MSTQKPDRSDPACTDSPEGFYARWSRRKGARRDDDAVGAADAVKADNGVAAEIGDAAAQPEPPAPTDADMPPLESLDGNSDVSGFMSPGVSEELRNKALRRVFLSGKFNVVDGLDDYDDDFTAFEGLGDLLTSDMRHQRELAEQRAREVAEREAAQDARATPGDDAPPVDDDLADTARATGPLDEPLTSASEAAGADTPPASHDENNRVSADLPAPGEQDDGPGGEGGGIGRA